MPEEKQPPRAQIFRYFRIDSRNNNNMVDWYDFLQKTEQSKLSRVEETKTPLKCQRNLRCVQMTMESTMILVGGLMDSI